MLNPPAAGKYVTPDQREQIEADYTFKRVVELELDPVRGNFDVAHLKEINRRIFQDLPGAGFDDVTPGEFRPPVLISRPKNVENCQTTKAMAATIAPITKKIQLSSLLLLLMRHHSII